MPLIEVEPNVLLDPTTGVRIVHVPGVKVTVHSIDGGYYDFRLPDSDPAAVWTVIRAHVAPAPGAATAILEVVEDIHRSLGSILRRLDRLEEEAEEADDVEVLTARLAAVEGHIDDADGEGGLAERLAAIEARLTTLERESDEPDGSCDPADSRGVALIAAERRRQVEREGWTPGHDDGHKDGELAISAAAYALLHTVEKPFSAELEPVGSCYPLKPKDPIRNLVRAGALIAAEIDRLSRLAPEPDGSQDPIDIITEGPAS